MNSYFMLLCVLACAVSAVRGSTLEESVQGVPGQDYPVYAEVPDTGFLCDGRINGGYYADPQAECQVFHVCSNNERYSFLCPNGTIFSQMYFVCDWWYNFDCSFAEQLYALNEQLFTDQEFDGRAFAENLGIVVGDGASSVVASGVRGVNGVSSLAGGSVFSGNGFGNGNGNTVINGNGNGNGNSFSNGNGNGNGGGSVFRMQVNSGGVKTGYGAPSNGKK